MPCSSVCMGIDAAGRLTEERFDKPGTEYEAEQKEIRQRLSLLQKLADSDAQEQHDLQQFLKSVRRYTGPQELTFERLNGFG